MDDAGLPQHTLSACRRRPRAGSHQRGRSAVPGHPDNYYTIRPAGSLADDAVAELVGAQPALRPASMVPSSSTSTPAPSARCSGSSQRVGGYDGYGTDNAPVCLATSGARWYRTVVTERAVARQRAQPEPAGPRQPEVYGATTLAEIEAAVTAPAAEFGLAVRAVQSNHEAC